MTQAYFVSDIHLKTSTESNSEKLLLFLHSLGSAERPCTHLFLVGDIFDLWIHDHSYFVEKFKKVVDAIKELVARGIEVHYFEGNHDLHLVNFWQQEVGVKVHEGPEFFNLSDKVIRVEHGDFMNPDDKAYLRLRKVLRSLPMTVLAKNLPGSLVRSIGERASKASRQYTSNQKSLHASKVRKFMHEYSEQVFKDKPYDYLITGHTHVRDEYVVTGNGRSALSINLGSWFDDQKALLIDQQGHRFIDL